MNSDFSLRDMLAAKVANTWGSVRSHEHNTHRALCEQYGDTGSRHAVRLPAGALDVRDMTVAGVSGSNYLVETGNGEYLPALVPFAAPLALGAQIVPVGPGNVTYPRGSAGATAYWLTDETTQITESQPSIVAMATAPKTLAAFVQVTHQALRQSNAEAVIRTELALAAGSALTTAVLAGTGVAGQPLGVIGTSGVGAFTGTTLGVTALRDAQEDIAASIINRGAVGFVTTPAVAELLATRQRFTGSSNTVWEGASHDGTVEGMRASSTTACPTAAGIVGDWSQCWVLEWGGGAQVLVDPYTHFNNGLVNLRLMLLVDVLVARPAAFTVATSIT